MIRNLKTNQPIHLICIFIVSFSILSYQIILTRVFSVVLHYHFAFLGVSLAMLGLTVGALTVYLNADRFNTERLNEEYAKAALKFSISSVGIVLWFLYSPLVPSPDLAEMMPKASLVLFVVPFTYGGICVSLLLTKSMVPVGRLYASDLIGAACGCMGVVATLFVFEPIGIILGLASLVAFSSWLMAPPMVPRLTRYAGVACLALLLGSVLQSGLSLGDWAHLRIVWAKLYKQDNNLFERWNAFSRVRVMPGNNDPVGWGFGRPQSQPVDQLILDIDADASTPMSRFDGNLKPFAFLSNDVINMAYHVRTPESTAVIGVGGGRDILSALYFGAHHVTGLELNPTIFEILSNRFADFSGHLDRRPEVSLINTEARSWLSEHQQLFDLIQISLFDTWAATAAGGLTLTENRLYTVEGWTDFMDRLTPRGMLSVSRWFDPALYPGEAYRLLSLATECLKRRGLPPAEARKHILGFATGRVFTLVVGKNAFSPTEVAAARLAATAEGFQVMVDSDHAWDPTAATIASGTADDDFFDGLSIDVTAPTDDRPFFFYLNRLRAGFSSAKYMSNTDDVHTDGDPRNFGNHSISAVSIMLITLVATVLWTIATVARPLIKLSKAMPVKEALPHLIYFGGIGLGFMLIEISQMQRLMIFLGHPIYGMTVVLFSLLLFGGIGSSTVGAQTSQRISILWRPLALCVVLAVTGLLTPMVTEQFRSYGSVIRVLFSVALLAPAGFFMGMMFPVGMAISARFRELQPWLWGVNGVISVFASVLGMLLSMQYGITVTNWAGIGVYTLCLGTMLYIRYKQKPDGSAPQPTTEPHAHPVLARHRRVEHSPAP